MSARKRSTAARLGTLLGMLALAGSAAPVAAQMTTFENLVPARQVTALVESGGTLVAGLAGGGLVLFPVDDLDAPERIPAGAELSGNAVTDMAWSGRHVWVATRGGGLTRIADVGGERGFRQYASNLGSRDVTCVAGTLLGGSERVFYGMDEGGVGLITDGIAGAVYTTQDGLVADDVTAVAVLDGVLFVGTPVGVSRFANNLFTLQNVGLPDPAIHDLVVTSDGILVAATEGGLYAWDDGAQTWNLLGGRTAPTQQVSEAGGLVYVLGDGTVEVWNGASWQTLSAPGGATAIHAGDAFWAGGTVTVEGSGGEYVVRDAVVGRLTGTTSFTTAQVSASQVLNAGGVAMSGGAPYIAAQAFQSVISSRQEAGWEHLRYQPASGDNAGERLGPGVLLSMDRGPDGALWATLYAGDGLARHDPATGQTDLISPDNSGLQARAIINVVVHPDGPVITMHDQEDFAKVEILVDPADWANPASWLALPRSGLGAEDATDVTDAVVERRDVIWFAVSEVGLVRWDINGSAAGPDDQLTWFDSADDTYDTVDFLPGTTLDLGAAFGLEMGADGSIWAGGAGLVQFAWDEDLRQATLLTALTEKGSAASVGLVNANVADIVRDHNGHIWVATAGGLNRVRGSGPEVEVDAYVDLANYFTNPTTAILYSPNIIAPLPGTTYRHICASADRRQILVSADQGAALVTVGNVGGGAAPTLASAYAYPNPYHGGAGQGALKLGGVPDEGPVLVEIYNLEGQLVYRDREVEPGEAFWNGINRIGNPVTTGMYVVRVTAGGSTQAFPLSVVR